MAYGHVARCSTSLIITEMQISATMRCHLTKGGMSVIKVYRQHQSLQTVPAAEGVEKWEPPYTTGGNVNCCVPCGKQYGGSTKN